MRNLIQIIIRHYFLLLFLIIQSFALSLVIRNNDFHQSRFLSFATALRGDLYARRESLNEYLSLRVANRRLAIENAMLRNRITRLSVNKYDSFPVTDSLSRIRFDYIPARVVNNIINRQNNYFTIDKGRSDSVHSEMAVVSVDGVVGIVQEVSEHYATVMSVLNQNFRISAKIRKNGYYGSLYWEGTNYRYASLSEIPYHVKIEIGDTLVTSGYSTIFPEGVQIGFIDKYENEEGNFYTISVKLANDMKRLNEVFVIRSLQQEERIELEKQFFNE